MKEKAVDDIIINDICLQAVVSRTAFYQHFEDKQALVMAWIFAEIKRPSELFHDDSLVEYYNRPFDAMSAQHDQIRNLVQLDGNRDLQWRISTMWSKGLMRYYDKKYQQGGRFEISIK